MQSNPTNGFFRSSFYYILVLSFQSGSKLNSMDPKVDSSGLKSKPSLPVRLGVVSFLNDCSGEILTRSLPLYFTACLGLSPTVLGLIEGIAETVAILVTAVSGWLSDRLPSRKPLVTLGYGVSALGRTLMFFTGVAPLIAAARVLDRFGKGVRTAPRDALIADDSHRSHVGRAFGIARSLDTIGAVTGLAFAILMGVGAATMTSDLFQKMLFTSVPFAWLAVLVLHLWVPQLPRVTHAKTYLSWHIPKEIRPFLLAVGVFAMGNSSDAFLVLRAKEMGFDFGSILSLFIVYNILASVVGWLVGQWSDRFGRKRFLVIGWIFYVFCYVLMAQESSMLAFGIVFSIYGAFYGLTDGVEKALLADLLPARKRGLGYGSFQMTLAIVAIPANLVTGYIATHYGLAQALMMSAIFSTAGVIIFLAVIPRLKAQEV